MAIVLTYTIDTNQSFTSVLNSLGLFLSSVGVVVAILTVIQQYYLHQSKEVATAVNSSNNFMFNLGLMLETYGYIKRNYLDQGDQTAGQIKLLDGELSHWLVKIDLEKNIFISEIDSQIYVDSYYAIFNYNRYIEGIFHWQRNQARHSETENVSYLMQRINDLEEFGDKLIDIQNKLHKLLKDNYPEHTFFHTQVPSDDFKNLVTSRQEHVEALEQARLNMY
ncbi:hypothetical protein F0Z19_4011 [Vibrio cyclitrophicus]|nr:hypothetical protein F0Z19_4011 [Vibrio cyclitrophicus]